MTTGFFANAARALSRRDAAWSRAAPEFFEPLAAIYPAACGGDCRRAQLRRGEFSMQDFVRAAIARELTDAARNFRRGGSSLFANLNTPADL